MRESPRHRRVGLHRLARRRPLLVTRATNRASSTSSRSPAMLDGEVDSVVGDILDAGGAARRRCAAATRSCISPRWPTSTRSRATRARRPRQRARHARDARSGAREGIARFVYASTIWVYGNAPGGEPLDEDALLVLPDSLLHGDQARRRDVLPLVRGDVRASSRRSCASGSRTGPRARATVVAALRRARARGRAAEHQRRRQPGAPVRVRRGSRRGHRGRARPAARRAATYNLVGDETRERARDRGHRAGAHRRRLDRARAGPARPTSAASQISGAARPGRARLAAEDDVRRRRRALHRLLAGDERLAESPRPPSSIAGSAATVLRQEPGAL